MEGIKTPPPPEGYYYSYVPRDNEYMQVGAWIVANHPHVHHHPIGIVAVKEGRIIGIGANGSDWHDEKGCERERLGIRTNERFDVCPGCGPDSHAEPQLLGCITAWGEDAKGADVYMYGHYWCCRDCWDRMIQAGIRHVYLMEEAEKYFDRESPDYIL